MSQTETSFSGVPERPLPFTGPRALRTREMLLSAARDLFFEKGFAGTSMEDVAARAGVSRASVYTYFPSKYVLFAELGVGTYRAINAVIDELAAVPARPADRDLETWITSLLTALDQHKAFVIQWNEAAAEEEEAREAWRSNELRLAKRLGDQLRRLAGWKGADSTRMGLGVLGMVSHLWIVWRVAEAPFSKKDVVKTLSASLGGLLRGYGGGD